MSLRLEILQVARLSPKLLGESADLTARFFTNRLNPDGGFQNRDGESDLYYTVFGLEGLCALQRDLPVAPVRRFLAARSRPDALAAPEPLDFVHTTCLARAWADVNAADEAPGSAILSRLETFRTPDGGYSATPKAEHGTAYGCFLAVGAYEDLGQSPSHPDRILACLSSLRAARGGYANQPGSATGLTPPTAAALTLIRRLGASPPDDAVAWLLEQHLPDGGFRASPMIPVPDLLSTATALHALSGAQAPIEAIREPCLDYVDSLWSNEGGFYGHWADDVQDCEYTFYGLLALGHLAV